MSQKGALGHLAAKLVQTFAKIQCPSCDAPIEASDLNLAFIFVTCRQCGASFDYTPQLGRSHDVTPRADQVIEQPEGIEISEEDDEFDLLSQRDETVPKGRLTLSRSWPRRTAVFIAFFAILWGGATTYVIIDGEAETGVLAIAVMVAALLLYLTLAFALNHTMITADRNSLTVQNGPVPWWGRRAIPSNEVFRFYCRRMEMADDEENPFDTKKESFFVDVSTKDGKRRPLLSSLRTAREARFIHQSLTRHLRIETPPFSR